MQPCQCAIADSLNVPVKKMGLMPPCVYTDEPTSKLAAKNASLKEILILGLPMCFDLTATLLMSIGLL